MKLVKELFINVTAGSTRVALLEGGILNELFIELPDFQRLVGNIYKGRIQNVIPGMQASFIDVGHEINAFLPFSEIGNLENPSNFSFSDNEDEEEPQKEPNKKYQKKKPNRLKSNDPAKFLKINEDILVQVIKEPFSGKGPRVTTDISIPGSLMVLVPNANYIGISRKITDKYEKRRLRRIAKEFKPEGYGLIIRTIAQGKDDSTIKSDFDRVWERWAELEAKVKSKDAPALVYKDFTTSDQVIRDLFTADISRLVVDSKPLYKRILNYINDIDPALGKKLELKKGKGSIFDEYSIEEQYDKSLKRKVWMKSGAHLVIEHTEAMLVIDVNSGRFIGKKDQEQNSLKINLESAREVARQLRLRDIGGLIVIDFIDLQKEENRKKVFDELKNALKGDRAKVSLTEFSTFGLLEMTRQRIRLSLLHTVSNDCPTCKGLGRISTPDTVLTRLENWLKRFRNNANDRRLSVMLNKEVLDYINETKSKAVIGFMWDNSMLIDLQEDKSLSPAEVRIYSKKRKIDVTDEV